MAGLGLGRGIFNSATFLTFGGFLKCHSLFSFLQFLNIALFPVGTQKTTGIFHGALSGSGLFSLIRPREGTKCSRLFFDLSPLIFMDNKDQEIKINRK